MKIAVFLALVTVSAQVLLPSVYGQKPKDDVVVMSAFNVITQPHSKTYEDIIRKLDHMFSPPPKMSDPAPVDEVEKNSARHTIEDSQTGFFDFGFHGADLKALRGGFQIGGVGFYLKRGIAHRPEYNKYVTYTFGKRVTWGYNFRNRHDLFQETIRRPIERFNYILENPVAFLGLSAR